VRRGRGERGETLIETLVTVMLMGTAITGLIGGITAAIGASDNSKQVVTAQVVAQNFAEAIQAAPYVECTTSYTTAQVGYTPPNGYAVTNPTVAFYDGTSNPAVFGAAPAGCSAATPKDNGAQRLTLRVAAPNGITVRTLEIVKRRP
jgi:Tfp pilus assembly protein PilV